MNKHIENIIDAWDHPIRQSEEPFQWLRELNAKVAPGY